MTIALQGRGDIGGLDVVAMIIDALRKLVKDIGSAAADIVHPVSGIDLEKVTSKRVAEFPATTCLNFR
jgi:hypothetical protein